MTAQNFEVMYDKFNGENMYWNKNIHKNKIKLQ
jgi:hypothetical protein